MRFDLLVAALRVAAHECDSTSSDVALANLQDERSAAAHPIPALLGGRNFLLVNISAQRQAEGGGPVQLVGDGVAVLEDGIVLVVAAQDRHEDDLPRRY